MAKITKTLYNFFKRRYFRQSGNINEIFSLSLAEVYNNPFTLQICGITYKQCQVGQDSSILITVYTKRPGLVIGKRGEDLNRFKSKLSEYLGEPVSIDLYEVEK